VSRTVFAMAADRHLPGALAEVHPRFRVPHRAEVAVGLVVTVVALFAPLDGAIGLSAFTVLLYYAITNASALTLRSEQRWRPRLVAWVGLVGCLVLAGTLPPMVVAVGSGLLIVSGLLYVRRHGRSTGGAGKAEGIVEGPE
jgi:basic amino acid/polyamine antiporter, APA family